MQNTPLLCFPSETKEEQISRLKAEMQKFKRFVAAENYITPEITQKFAEKSFNVRMETLKRVYKNEYYSDSFDTARLVARISDGNEMIWFWGSAKELTRLDEYFHANHDSELQSFNVGTITVINSAEEFGAGTAELCRCGSTTLRVAGNPPLIQQILNYLSAEDLEMHNRYHTICFVPRTRKSDANVRGGEAVKSIYTNDIKSRFWGFAPWYVMQGGVLELLEYREINRDVSDVISATKSMGELYLADAQEAILVQNLFQLNFNLQPEIVIGAGEDNTDQIFAKLISIKDENIKALNHETLICFPSSQKMQEVGVNYFDALLNELLTNVSSCKVIRLDLSDVSHSHIQKEIRKLGFRLMLISPPKDTWYIDENQGETRVKVPPYGYWCLPNPNVPIAMPYYMEYQPYNQFEHQILKYYEQLLPVSIVENVF